MRPQRIGQNLVIEQQQQQQNIRRLTDMENRIVVAKREGAEGGVGREAGVSGCKLLSTGWMTNKVPLYSTGNYSQYPVINHTGKGYERECVHMYIHRTESLCVQPTIKLK